MGLIIYIKMHQIQIYTEIWFRTDRRIHGRSTKLYPINFENHEAYEKKLVEYNKFGFVILLFGFQFNIDKTT